VAGRRRTGRLVRRPSHRP